MIRKQYFFLLRESVIIMLIAFGICYLIFLVFATIAGVFDVADYPELKSTVIGMIMWLPYTGLMCMRFIISAQKDALEGHYKLKDGICLSLLVTAAYLFICLLGVGTRHLDSSFWGLIVGAFSPLILWIPNIFLAALPILTLNMILYIIFYWLAGRANQKKQNNLNRT